VSAFFPQEKTKTALVLTKYPNMSSEGLPPHTAPKDSHLFDEICGVSENVTHSSTPPSTSGFGEWTPSDLWYPSYQGLLQGNPDAPFSRNIAQAHAVTPEPDRSHSSNASDAGAFSVCYLLSLGSAGTISGVDVASVYGTFVENCVRNNQRHRCTGESTSDRSVCPSVYCSGKGTDLS